MGSLLITNSVIIASVAIILRILFPYTANEKLVTYLAFGLIGLVVFLPLAISFLPRRLGESKICTMIQERIPYRDSFPSVMVIIVSIITIPGVPADTDACIVMSLLALLIGPTIYCIITSQSYIWTVCILLVSIVTIDAMLLFPSAWSWLIAIVGILVLDVAGSCGLSEYCIFSDDDPIASLYGPYGPDE
ncbi:MAG: hypothetical protein WC477_02785 [Patescibacteria group bacterium]